MNCEHCGVSDSDKEVRLSDTAPDTWLCRECFELNPHHSDWNSLKQRPYYENHNVRVSIPMNREALEHVIELLENDAKNPDLDLENNSINDIGNLQYQLEKSLEDAR